MNANRGISAENSTIYEMRDIVVKYRPIEFSITRYRHKRINWAMSSKNG